MAVSITTGVEGPDVLAYTLVQDVNGVDISIDLGTPNVFHFKSDANQKDTPWVFQITSKGKTTYVYLFHTDKCTLDWQDQTAEVNLYPLVYA